MVDWSAASAPKTGKDSVWWCLCVWRGGRLVMEANKNSPTRQLCFDVLRTQLRKLVADGSSVLVGFDFPFGYPAGFAAALGLGGQRFNCMPLSQLILSALSTVCEKPTDMREECNQFGSYGAMVL